MAEGNTYTNKIILQLDDSSRTEIQKQDEEDSKRQQEKINLFVEGVKKTVGEFSGQFKQSVLKLPDDFKLGAGAIMTVAVNLAQKLAQKIGEYIDEVKKYAIDMIEDISTFSRDTNVFSKEATDLAMNYGLTGANAYAWTKALEETGFGSIDDYIENGWAATEETNNRLKNLLEVYKQSYKDNEKFATNFQNFKNDWEDIKKQFAVEIINFFSTNKDLIKTFLSVTLTIMRGLLNAVQTIVRFLGFNPDVSRTDVQKASDLSDIVSSGIYTTNTSRNNSLIQNNTFNVSQSNLNSATNAANNQFQTNYDYISR